MPQTWKLAQIHGHWLAFNWGCKRYFRPAKDGEHQQQHWEAAHG
jgi:hypothetical protein